VGSLTCGWEDFRGNYWAGISGITTREEFGGVQNLYGNGHGGKFEREYRKSVEGKSEE